VNPPSYHDIPQHLSAWKASLLAELASLEQQAHALRLAIAEKQSKIHAIDRLLGPSCTSEESVQTFDISASIEPDSASDLLTPAKAYWRPILSVLVELGGRARRQKVIDLVGKKMEHVLTPADHVRLPSFGIRWEHVVAWQASHMRRVAGLIRNDSPRGVWEITDAGREWLHHQD
jgi:hypothetical protein